MEISFTSMDLRQCLLALSFMPVQPALLDGGAWWPGVESFPPGEHNQPPSSLASATLLFIYCCVGFQWHVEKNGYKNLPKLQHF